MAVAKERFVNFHYHGPVVAFDLDDTLYYERSFVESALRAVARMDIMREVGEECELYSAMLSAFEAGQNVFDAISERVADSGYDYSALLPEMINTYRYHLPQIKLSEETAVVLEELQKSGVAMALVTDGRSRTQRAKIAALGLDKYFREESIFISEERGSDKISGKSFREIVRMWPEASGFFYIGDNPAKDFKSANMLGWTTICLMHNGKGVHPQQFAGGISDPVKTVESIWDVAEIIMRKNKADNGKR